MRPNLLIIGGTGLLGINWAFESVEKYNVAISQHKRKLVLPNIKSLDIELENKASIEASVKQIQPELVINAAGMTNVEACEKEPALARFVNAELAANIASVCSAHNIGFIHISTDHLFDGSQSFLSEETAPCPLNAYGASKAYAEELVLQAHPDALILRCNFYGWGTTYRRSFSDFIYQNLTQGQEIKLFNDVFSTPVTTRQMIQHAHRLVALKVKGIFNMAGVERLSKYDFGLRMADFFHLNRALIHECSIDEFDFVANRPKDMSLSDKKICALLKQGLGSITQNFDILEQQLNSKFGKTVSAL